MNDLPSFVIREKDIGYSVQVSGTDMLNVCLEIPESCFEAYCDLIVEMVEK